MWILFAVLSAVFAALTSILAKVGIENVNSNLATAIRTAVVLVMAWGMVFLTHAQSGLPEISKKKLAFSDTIRYRDRRFVALLLPRASARRSVKGRSYRQAERCDNADFGVHFPARGIHREIAYRLHFNRRGNADYGHLMNFRKPCSAKTAPAVQTQSETARTVFSANRSR